MLPERFGLLKLIQGRHLSGQVMQYPFLLLGQESSRSALSAPRNGNLPRCATQTRSEPHPQDEPLLPPTGTLLWHCLDIWTGRSTAMLVKALNLQLTSRRTSANEALCLSSSSMTCTQHFHFGKVGFSVDRKAGSLEDRHDNPKTSSMTESLFHHKVGKQESETNCHYCQTKLNTRLLSSTMY